jgi:hypothetical protein
MTDFPYPIHTCSQQQENISPQYYSNHQNVSLRQNRPNNRSTMVRKCPIFISQSIILTPSRNEPPPRATSFRGGHETRVVYLPPNTRHSHERSSSRHSHHRRSEDHHRHGHEGGHHHERRRSRSRDGGRHGGHEGRRSRSIDSRDSYESVERVVRVRPVQRRIRF